LLLARFILDLGYVELDSLLHSPSKLPSLIPSIPSIHMQRHYFCRFYFIKRPRFVGYGDLHWRTCIGSVTVGRFCFISCELKLRHIRTARKYVLPKITEIFNPLTISKAKLCIRPLGSIHSSITIPMMLLAPSSIAPWIGFTQLLVVHGTAIVCPEGFANVACTWPLIGCLDLFWHYALAS